MPRRLVCLVALAACGGAAHPAARVAPGVAIAVYGDHAIVDERRELLLDGGAVAIDHIAPGAELASLWITVPGEPRIAIDHCTRPELAIEPAGSAGDADTVQAPVVQCRVTGGARGRHLVRVVYTADGFAVTTEHAIDVTDPEPASLRAGGPCAMTRSVEPCSTDLAHARVVTRFAVATPRWGGRAQIAVLDGSGAEAHEQARADIALDGSTAVFGTAPRDVPAHLRWIYNGAVSDDTDPTAPEWHDVSTTAVRVWLELDMPALPPGVVHVHVATAETATGTAPRDVDAAGAVRDGSDHSRVLLWTDPALVGERSRDATGELGELAETIRLSVENSGTAPREVWLEEQARPGAHRRIWRAQHYSGALPAFHGDVVRAVVHVAPGAIERVAYSIQYPSSP